MALNAYGRKATKGFSGARRMFNNAKNFIKKFTNNKPKNTGGGKGGNGGRKPPGQNPKNPDKDRGSSSGNCKHSFNPATPVLMADGSAQPIGEIKEGDKVLAHEPGTGETKAEKVERTHTNRDTDLANVSIRVKGGKFLTLQTTQNHPFWSESRSRWVDAKDLQPTELLHTATGEVVSVAKVDNFTGRTTMHDLTVATIHTYYVVAGNTPVLVHNCDFGPGVADIKYDKHVLGEGKKDGPDMPEYDYDGGFEKYVDDAKALMCGDTCPAGATQTTRTLDGVSTVIRMDAKGRVGMRVGNRITTYFRPDNPLEFFGKEANR